MLVYYLIMPLAIKFFLSFESSGLSTNLPIQLEAKVNEYLSLVMKLIFAFGISFQLPVVLSLLARIGVVDSEFLKKRRKYVIVIIFAAAADGADASLSSKFCVWDACTALKLDINITSTLAINLTTSSL